MCFYFTYVSILAMIDPTPYTNLTPDLILESIESLGFICSGSLLALNSYENRVYQVGIEDSKPMVAKFYRPRRWSNEAILEEHSFALELLDHEIPVIAPWRDRQNNSLHQYQKFRFALFPCEGGRALELDHLEQLEWMGRFIGRLHAVGACKPFQHRSQLDVKTYGYNSLEFLLNHDFIPLHLKQNYQDIAEKLLTKIEETYQQVGEINIIRCHGDMHSGNVLWRDAAPHIVDLDDCIMAPAIQDIWMLLSGDKDQTRLQLAHILRGYREFYEFNRQELNLIESLRTLRMLMYSGWLAKRWEDPTFPLNFPWFNTSHYWQEQIVNLNQQIRALN